MSGVKGQLNGAIKRIETAAAAVLLSTGMAGTTQKEVEAPPVLQFVPSSKPSTSDTSSLYPTHPTAGDPTSYLPAMPSSNHAPPGTGHA